MLQAMTLEIAPTALKAQAGGRNASEPAAAPFTEVMAQTSLASAAQPATLPTASVPNGDWKTVQDETAGTGSSPNPPAPPSSGTSAGETAKPAEKANVAEVDLPLPDVVPSQPGPEGSVEMPQVPADTGTKGSGKPKSNPDGEAPSPVPVESQPAWLQAAAFAPAVQGTVPPESAPQPAVDGEVASSAGSSQAAVVPPASGQAGLAQQADSVLAAMPQPDPGAKPTPAEAPLPDLDKKSVPLDTPRLDPDVNAVAADTPPPRSNPAAPVHRDTASSPQDTRTPSPQVTSEAASLSAAPPSSEALPRELRQTFVLDADTPATPDAPSPASGTARRAEAAPIPDAAGHQAAPAATDPETAEILPGDPATLLETADAAEAGPTAQTADPAPPGGPASPAAATAALQMDATTAKPDRTRAHAPNAASSGRVPPDSVPAQNTEPAGGKDPQSSAWNAREGTSWAAMGKTAETGSARETQAAPAEGFAQPMAEALRPSSATPRTEPVPVKSDPVFAQVEGSVRWILQNKSKEAELQLHPEALGRVTVQLRVEGQEVHARLWTSEASSMAVLQEHKASLAASLKAQGLSLGSFDLHFGARQDQPQTPSQAWNSGSYPRAAFAEAKQEIPSRQAGPAPAEYLDPHQIEVYA